MVRDPWLDNAKMALVTLVVLGHAWTLLPDSGSTRSLYDALYAWHLPAFVFVTGYLSRSFAYTPARMWQLVRTVVVPYLIFECLLALFRIHVGGEDLSRLFENPHWPMWYLAALFFWRLLTPAFTQAPAVARGRRRGGDQPGRRASGPATPSTSPGSSACCRSSCSVCMLTPERLAAVVDPARRRVAALVLAVVRASSRSGPTRWPRPSGSTTASRYARARRRRLRGPC